MSTTPIKRTSKGARQAFYAAAGVADLAASKVRHLPEEAERLRSRLPGEAEKLRKRLPAEARKTYGSLVERGETLLGNITGSRSAQEARRATRAAVSRTKGAATTARSSARSTSSSAKGASTTVRRAVQRDAEAAADAASKVGER